MKIWLTSLSVLMAGATFAQEASPPETPESKATYAGQMPEGSHLLLTSHKPDGVYLLECGGEIRWSFAGELHHPQQAQDLDDGSILFAEVNGARQVDLSEKVLWQYAVPQGCQNAMAQQYTPGRFWVGHEGPCDLLEVDQAGTVLQTIDLQSPAEKVHGQFRYVTQSPQGTFLVPMTISHIFREYNTDGEVLFEITEDLKLPTKAIRLDDGSTLLADHSTVRQFDQEGQVLWQFNLVEDGGLETPCALTGHGIACPMATC